jgi:hypothetical protein
MATRARASFEIAPLTTLANGFEISVHTLPPAFRADLAGVLPATPLDGLLLVPTAQRSAVDLAAWGEEAAREKDALLERFAAWADAVGARLRARGFWADAVDPCSGLARATPHSHVPYPEVDAFETLLRWRTSDAGGCRLLLHPRWGAAVYPATLFARAPLDEVLAALHEAAAAAADAPAAAAAAADAPAAAAAAAAPA